MAMRSIFALYFDPSTLQYMTQQMNDLSKTYKKQKTKYCVGSEPREWITHHLAVSCTLYAKGFCSGSVLYV